MHPATTDRDRVLAVITSALSELESGAPGPELHGMSRQDLAAALREGLEFMTHEEPRLAAYTRGVTLAWVVYFALTSIVSIVPRPA